MLSLPPDTLLLWKSHDDSIAQRTAIDQARQERGPTHAHSHSHALAHAHAAPSHVHSHSQGLVHKQPHQIPPRHQATLEKRRTGGLPGAKGESAAAAV